MSGLLHAALEDGGHTLADVDRFGHGGRPVRGGGLDWNKVDWDSFDRPTAPEKPTPTGPKIDELPVKRTAHAGEDLVQVQDYSKKAIEDSNKTARSAARSSAWSADRVGSGVGKLATGGAVGFVTVYAGVNTVNRLNRLADRLGKIPGDLLDLFKDIPNHAPDLNPGHWLDGMLGQLHQLEAGVAKPFGRVGSTVETAVEGAITVVTIAGTVYILYEGYRYFSN